MAKSRDFLAITDLTRNEFINLINYSVRLKAQTKAGICPQLFDGKMAGLIFHKPSLRTRISFEVGVHQLGGGSMFITDKEIQLGVRESIADAGKVLDRFLDLIVIRTFHQKYLIDLAQWAEIPIINALTDLLHPCQIFCDMLTIKEKHGILEGMKIVYLGDGNNIARSWMNAAKLLDIDLWVVTPPETHPGEEFLKEALNGAKGKITISNDPIKSVRNADILYGDVWASMGEKDQAKERAELLKPYQLNNELLDEAKPSCMVMHCLPAERGKEITDDVIDGPQSIVFDQAENRLHGQKALMLWTKGEI